MSKRERMNKKIKASEEIDRRSFPSKLIPELRVCPSCSSRSVNISRIDNHYTFWRCIDCYVEFMDKELLSHCAHPMSSGIVKQSACHKCSYVVFKPNANNPCPHWRGILEPPKELKEEFKKAKTRKQAAY